METSKATDIVCGMNVPMENPTAKSEFEGNVYYFCSQDCREKFEKDPGLYIGKQEIQGEKEPIPSTAVE